MKIIELYCFDLKFVMFFFKIVQLLMNYLIYIMNSFINVLQINFHKIINAYFLYLN